MQRKNAAGSIQRPDRPGVTFSPSRQQSVDGTRKNAPEFPVSHQHKLALTGTEDIREDTRPGASVKRVKAPHGRNAKNGRLTVPVGPLTETNSKNDHPMDHWCL